jgi:anti-sigma regulatory factor (Ser/Thr protein kinase)
MSSQLDEVRPAVTTGRRFSPSRNAPALARRFARGYLADAGADARCQQITELLVSELVTNALVHAHTTARLWITLTEDTVRVEVTDDGPGEPVLKDPGPDGGYGLWLTDMLARFWGVTHRADSRDKTVWCTVPLTVAGAAPAPGPALRAQLN